MKKYSVIILFFLLFSAYAQDTLRVTANGYDLRDIYLSLDVEHLWQAGYHVDWKTGESDEPWAKSGNKTHCSAFVAAACSHLNMYVLRPPEHKQELLANSQFEWLASDAGKKAGWVQIADENILDIWIAAQEKANDGYAVIASCANEDPRSPGHIALVMPSEVITDSVKASGPKVIQAGAMNRNEVSLRKGFGKHISEWPEKTILFYYHEK